jgi:hypothetical protein
VHSHINEHCLIMLTECTVFIHFVHLFISSTCFGDECDAETCRINTINTINIRIEKNIVHLVGIIKEFLPLSDNK